jgi:hypothetical protein
MQAIYDLVGDRLRDTFDAQVVMISQYDPLTKLLFHRYAIEREERHLLEPAHGPVRRLFHVFTVGVRGMFARWRLHRLIERAVVQAARQSPTLAAHAGRLAATARRYADRRLDAGRRVAEFRVYTRLFSLWHVLHVPLFVMLLIAGVVHVISVQIY